MRGYHRERKFVLTVGQKLRVLKALSRGASMATLARRFKVNKRVIRDIRRQRTEITTFGKRGGHLLQHRNRIRSWNEKMENLLYSWIQDQQAAGNRLSDRIIRKKALKISKEVGSTSFLASAGWYNRFVKRYGIDESQVPRESTTAETRRLTDDETSESDAEDETSENDTESENAEGETAKSVGKGRITRSVARGRITRSVTKGKIAKSVTKGKTAKSIAKGKAAKSVAEGKTAKSVAEGESAKSIAEGETAKSVTEGETTESIAEGEIAKSVVEGQTVQSVTEGETAVIVAEGVTAERVAEGETAERVAGGKTAERVAEGETAERVAEGKTAESIAQGKTAESVAQGKTAESIAQGKTAESIAEGVTAERVTESETAESIAEGVTAERVTESETTERVAEGETAERVAEGETAERVAEGETAKRVAEGDTAKRVADVSTESVKQEEIDIQDTIVEGNIDVGGIVGTHSQNIKIERVTEGEIAESVADASTQSMKQEEIDIEDTIIEGNIEVGGILGTHSQNIKIEREEQGIYEAVDWEEPEFSSVETKRADLCEFEEILLKYANNLQDVLIMGEAITRILKIEKPEIR
jgi:hypothetical protein